MELQAILAILEMFVSLLVNNNLGILCLYSSDMFEFPLMANTVYSDCWHVIRIWPSDIPRHIQRTKKAMNILSLDTVEN